MSVALPGSIIANAKSHDQKTYLAGTLARALAVFCVDEIIIFDDEGEPAPEHQHQHQDNRGTVSSVADGEYTAFSNPCHFLAHILSYLETPPHLRKTLFPMHPNLRTAGTLPSLDMPHHLRANEWCEYREGVTTHSSPAGTVVDIGLPETTLLRDVEIPPKARVTVKLDDNNRSSSSTAEAVSPSTPREAAGYYWGYSVRRCSSLSNVFTESPFDGGYDLSFGTSERGTALSSILPQGTPSFKHMLIVFGGVSGLELAARNDPELQRMDIGGSNVSELFDHWVNVLPGQGSRTIRTEEAVWLGLMGLRNVVENNSANG